MFFIFLDRFVLFHVFLFAWCFCRFFIVLSKCISYFVCLFGVACVFIFFSQTFIELFLNTAGGPAAASAAGVLTLALPVVQLLQQTSRLPHPVSTPCRAPRRYRRGAVVSVSPHFKAVTVPTKVGHKLPGGETFTHTFS